MEESVKPATTTCVSEPKGLKCASDGTARIKTSSLRAAVDEDAKKEVEDDEADRDGGASV